MGLTTCSDPGFAVLQPSFRLGKQEKGNSFILLRAFFFWTAPAKTAMMSPSFLSAINNIVPSTVHIVVLHSLLGRLPIPVCSTCFFFYSKCWAQLTGYSGWQAARMCLFPSLFSSSLFMMCGVDRQACCPQTQCWRWVQVQATWPSNSWRRPRRSVLQLWQLSHPICSLAYLLVA